MPYDQSLDECLASKEWESEKGKVVVSVYAYNGGAKKMQIARENRNSQGEFRFAKLGRMTKEEVEGILPLMQELAPQLD